MGGRTTPARAFPHHASAPYSAHPSSVDSRATAQRPGRRARRAAETREKLFRAALQQFAERGFQATTVEQITEAADVGKGTFFNYFPTKEHVLAAFGDLQLSRVERLLAAVRQGGRPFLELFREFLGAIGEEPGRSPHLMRALMAAKMTSEPVRRILCERMLRGRALLAEALRLAQKRGEVRRDVEPQLLARNLQQAFFGTMLLWCVNPTEPLAQRIADMCPLVWPALSPARARRGRRAG